MDQEPGSLKPKKPSLLNGMLVFSEITAILISPLILIGGLGYLLAKYAFGGSKIVFLIAILIAFVVSNMLAYRKAKDISKKRLV